MVILYGMWSSGIFPPVLVCGSKKNLATLVWAPVGLHAKALHFRWKVGWKKADILFTGARAPKTLCA
jgi:hypothetical protein